MSVRTVRNEIQHAMKSGSSCEGSFISETKAKKITREAEKNGVTPGEAKLVDDLLEKGHVQQPGMMMTMACPEHPADYVSLDPKAAGEFNAMFVRNSLPLGSNAATLKGQIQAV